MEIGLLVLSGASLWPWMMFQRFSATGKIVLVAVALLDIVLLAALYVRRYRRYRAWINTLNSGYIGPAHKIAMPGILEKKAAPGDAFQPQPELIDSLMMENRKRT